MTEGKPVITVDGAEHTAEANWLGHGLVVHGPEVAASEPGPVAELEAEAAA